MARMNRNKCRIRETLFQRSHMQCGGMALLKNVQQVYKWQSTVEKNIAGHFRRPCLEV